MSKNQKKEAFEDEIRNSLLISKKIYYYKEKEYQDNAKVELSEYLQDPIEKYTSDKKEWDALKKDLTEFLSNIRNEENKIPEFLCCPLTKELMKKPMLLSSGHTYEKEDIQKYIKENGYKDPQTSEKVSATMIENINLRHAIEEFIEK